MGNTVGVLTYHRGFNFGAVLQAFALQRAIANLGHSCSIVDYQAPDEATSYPYLRMPLSRTAASADALLLLNVRSHLRSRQRYESFRSGHLSLTSASYRWADELVRAGLPFQAYVSGSDQIWHPALMDRPGGPVFFQEFVASSRRVAYAPSFGVSEIPSRHRDRIRRAIERFAFLSAREQSGCDIIRQLTGREAEHVLDPTLLHEAGTYDRIAGCPALSEKYILVYATEHSDRLRELAVAMRSRLKLPIVAVLPWYFAPWRYSYADHRIYDAGPAEFLGWMKNATLVCTNSFHGMCFSIVYRKSFVGVPHRSTGTRQQGLLSLLGLSSRLVDAPCALQDRSLEPIDYEPVQELLREAVGRSLRYLERALA